MTKHDYDIKVGDTVVFGAYGDFDNDIPYTVIEVQDAPMFIGGIQYIIQGEDGHPFSVFADEVLPMMEYIRRKNAKKIIVKVKDDDGNEYDYKYDYGLGDEPQYD